MLFRLVRPVQRKGSRNVQLVKRIPSDVRERAIGTRLAIPVGDRTVRVLITAKMDAIRLSLGTSDPTAAKVRQGEALAYLEQVFAGLRADAPISLTNRQATALAGRLYRAWAHEAGERSISVTFGYDGVPVPDEGDLPEEAAAVWSATVASLNLVEAKGDLEPTLGPLVDRLLLAEGVGQEDVPSRRLLLHAFWLALKDAFEVKERNAQGDYTPDPKSERFPEWVPPSKPATAEEGNSTTADDAALTLTSLLASWWAEHKAVGLRPSTHDNYRNTVTQLIAFLGRDDARSVTPEDVIAFKDHRLQTLSPRTGKPVSARTVNDTNLAALKSIFGWAMKNRKLPSNPAEGVSVKRSKRPKLRERGFNEDEAKTILKAALAIEHNPKRPQWSAAQRWVPWLLAYTGARVGEIAQLRREDLVKTGDHWSIRITPEAGSVKTNEARIVPLHPHLVELGVLKFIEGSEPGYLFVQGGPGRSSRKSRPVGTTSRGRRILSPPAPLPEANMDGRLKGLKNHLREWIRQYVRDPNVQPNHGWRHLFITRSRAFGMDQELRRMITGHSGDAVDERVYGDPAGLYREICKLPRFGVGPAA